ncbi:MAG: HAD hydrolase-like protein [Bacteroidetes bacterium]|nr:HAD hydrolase-like protein [Bacteroidota bacterium]
MNPQQKLIELQPTREFFIGIDSDGCVFDSMEPKQKEFFCPNVIRFFGLLPVSKIARETWEFVNLYSQTRGVNRFLALIECFKLLQERPEIKERNISIPDIASLVEWTEKETKLGNPALESYASTVNNPQIDLVLKWSKTVNKEIGEWIKGLVPFPNFKESLEKLVRKADAIVVSQTPVEALRREWEENDIAKYVRAIAGQEYGTKAEHLVLAAKNKYPDNKILMIGDAPGDLKAAKTNGVLFFPVNPGYEEKSWDRFSKEALNKFFTGTYEGEYENSLIEEFQSFLPETPPWQGE